MDRLLSVDPRSYWAPLYSSFLTVRTALFGDQPSNRSERPPAGAFLGPPRSPCRWRGSSAPARATLPRRVLESLTAFL